MCKKLISLLLLFVLLLSQLFSQSVDSLLVEQADIIQELKNLENERNNLLKNLTDTNNERLKEIEERENEISKLEFNLDDLKQLDRQRQKDLIASQRSITFWRTTTVVLGVTTLCGIITIAVMASK